MIIDIFQMETTVKIKKWGNNLGICIPQIIVTEMSLREGLYMNINENGKRIIIEPVTQNNPFNLTDMLNNISEINTHRAIETGEPVGNEIW